MATSKTIVLVRDQDCPECGFPETFSEHAEDDGTLIAVGCRKCDWSVEVASRSGEQA